MAILGRRVSPPGRRIAAHDALQRFGLVSIADDTKVDKRIETIQVFRS
jgi:hypothetical protein